MKLHVNSVYVMKRMSFILKNLTLLGQLGLSFLTPILLCLLICLFLEHRFGAPLWIYIPGFVLGLGGSFMTAWKFYQATMKQEQDTTDRADRRRGGSEGLFNRHY